MGAEVEVIFADSDGVQQSQQLLKVIQSDRIRQPEAIIVEPAGATTLPQVARAAVAAGIGWVVVNREAEYVADLRQSYPVPIFSVGANQEEVGRIQGRQFQRLLPTGGSVIYVQGPSTSPVSRERAAGMYETKPDNIRLKVIKAGNWTEEGGYQALSSWLRLSTAQKEHIDLVGCQNDLIAMGARRAFHEHGGGESAVARLPFVGVDGLPKTGQQWVRNRTLKATVVVPPTTAPAVQLLIAWLRTGNPAPHSKLIEPQSHPSLEQLTA